MQHGTATAQHIPHLGWPSIVAIRLSLLTQARLCHVPGADVEASHCQRWRRKVSDGVQKAEKGALPLCSALVLSQTDVPSFYRSPSSGPQTCTTILKQRSCLSQSPQRKASAILWKLVAGPASRMLDKEVHCLASSFPLAHTRAHLNFSRTSVTPL